MKEKAIDRLLKFRTRYINDRQFIIILSIFIGLAVGVAASLIKTLVHYIQEFVKEGYIGHLWFIFPFIGVILTVLYIKYINKRPVRHGIPSVLFAISKNNGIIRPHNLYSSIITSALTVGFGGSVGLEGPTVATGAAIGSNIGKALKLEYKQVVVLMGCACAGAMAAIFKAPIAAIIFSLEVIMLDLTMSTLVPLLISSSSAVIVSYILLGKTETYPNFEMTASFELSSIPYYLILGVVTGLLSVYFTRMYMFITEKFEKIKNDFLRVLIGTSSLGLLIFLFPALYGEGYEITNQCLAGIDSHILNGSFFENIISNNWLILGVIFFMVFLKVVATSLTFGSGGIGGIFAPTLFIGAVSGLVFGKALGLIGIDSSPEQFALAGMGGMIAGVIHAPLTAIFLIADLTKGYELFVPLMLVATISYVTIRIFETNSVYTIQLAQRGELLTHHKDKAMFLLMNLDNLIEKDFIKVHPDQTLRDLVGVVSKSHRNVFPVVDEDEKMVGVLTLNDIRNIMFQTELYDTTHIRNIMYFPAVFVDYKDSLEQIAEKIESSGRYNVPVLNDGKYLGFVSRAKIFSTYRKMLKEYSDH